MIPIEVKVDEKQWNRTRRFLRTLGQGRVLQYRVLRRAVNRTATGVRSRLVKSLAAVVGLPQKDIRAQTRLSPWKTGQKGHRWRSAAVYLRAYTIPLIKLRARQTRQGVTHRATGAEGRALRRHAFIATMPRGHRGVYRRVGPARLPIREQFEHSLVDVFLNTPGLQSDIERYARDTLRKRVEHEAKYELDKFMRKSA